MSTTELGPYGMHAQLYYEAGWHGVLPLPPGEKYPPPKGFTGAGALMPSRADVQTWLDGDEARWNVGLRLPATHVGIDVDAYDDKQGRWTLEKLVREHGPLPDTFRISSREDGLSGIYLYGIPTGLRWPGIAGPGIDVIEHGKRYAVAPPSRHPNGSRYRWWAGDGLPVDYVPAPTDMPELPASWVQALTHGQRYAEIDKVPVSDNVLWSWLHSRPGGMPCPEVHSSMTRTADRLGLPGYSRHDAMTTGVMHLTHLAAEGHHGAEFALSIVHDRFIRVATIGASARDLDSAELEWHRALAGAAGVALTELDTMGDLDPCSAPLGVAAIMPASSPQSHADELGAPGRHREASEGIVAAQGGAEDSAGESSSHDPSVLSGGDALVSGALDEERVQSNASVKSLGANELAAMIVAVDYEVQRMRIRMMARDIIDTERATAQWQQPNTPDLADLLAAPIDPVAWVVDQLMPVESNVVLTAQYKSGKTTLVLNLARALVDSAYFLDTYAITPFGGNVAIWNYEVSQRMFIEWIRAQGMTNVDRLKLLNLRGQSVPIDTPIGKEWATRWLRDNQVYVWIVDPFAPAMRGDENSNTDVTAWLNAFDEVKAAAGVSVGLVVTHTGRSESAAERSRGATRIDDWADVRWLLSADSERLRYFQGTGRDVETPKGRLDFEPISRRLIFTGEKMPPRIKAGKRNLADEILAAVNETPGIGTRALIDLLHAGKTTVIDTLRLLEQQSLITIVRQGEGKPLSVYLPDAATALRAIS